MRPLDLILLTGTMLGYLGLLSVLIMLAPASLMAQTRLAPLEISTEPPRVRLGPLGLTPSIAITDVGVDTNVFAAPDDPQRDYTARVATRLASTVRMRWARLAGRTLLGYSYFRQAKQERTADVQQDGQLAFVLNRVSTRVSGGYGRLRQRPNLEIDARVRRVAQHGGLGIDLRLSPRFELKFDAGQFRLDYANEQFGGVNLGTELSQRTERAVVFARMALTPLTTFVVATDVTQDRFQLSPIRNTNSAGVLPGLELKPFALVSGTVFIGYRRVQMLDETVPDYQGLVGNLAVNYTYNARTRFALTGHREVEYSFESLTPYYVGSGAGLTITRALLRSWDVRGIFSLDTLAYRKLDAVPATAARVDRVTVYGFGVGRRVGANARVGVDVTHVLRYSPIRARGYEGWRAGGVLTYGS